MLTILFGSCQTETNQSPSGSFKKHDTTKHIESLRSPGPPDTLNNPKTREINCINKKVFDSLYYISESNPSLRLMELLQQEEINASQKLIQPNKGGSNLDFVLKQLLAESKTDERSGVKEMLIRNLNFNGLYVNDSSFVAPYYYKYDGIGGCDLMSSVITVKTSMIYERPNVDSPIFHQIQSDVIIEFSNIVSSSPVSKSNHANEQIPLIDVSNTWYFIRKYGGYVKGTDVWCFQEPLYKYKRINNKWYLTEILQFE
jgi:hypothetical protein